MTTLIITILICFACIQVIEILAFLSRLSGVLIQKRSMAYTLQSAVFMLTRFFTLALMPILGLLVDMNIDKHLYLIMCFLAVLISSISCCIIMCFRSRAVSAFIEIIQQVVQGKHLLISLVKFPYYFFQYPKKHIVLPKLRYLISSNIFWLSSFVFFSYALSLFLVFFLGLFFPEYKVTLSQTSGMINAFSTILLTFWIEPKLSLTIDSDDLNQSNSMLLSLILGRIMGVGVYTSIFFIGLYFLV